MTLTVWKNEQGRLRLEKLYERFLGKISVPVESIEVKTSTGPNHILCAGPESGQKFICLHAMRTGSAFLLSELGPLLE